MARLIHSINVTLDGCVAPEHAIADEEHHEYATTMLRNSAAVLLGRNTYELFEAYWPNVAKGGHEAPYVVAFARELDAKLKYVVSNSRKPTNWTNAESVTGDIATEIQTLKTRGDLILFGSPGLAGSLAALNAIDEFHIAIQPIVAGTGPTLFAGLARKLELVSIDTKVFRSGVILNRFLPRPA